jgi:hypothetical protein
VKRLIAAAGSICLILILVALMLPACGGDGDSGTPGPAEFEVISLDVEPTEVTTGDTLTITAVVENTGGSEGTYNAVLTVDDDIVETKEVTLAAGETQMATFSLVVTEAGTYQLGVGELSAGLTVNEELEPAPTDTWTLSAPLYLLGVIGGETFMEVWSYQESWELSFGFEGSSSFDTLCQEQIPEHWDWIREDNTIIMFSTSLENLQRLSEWPEQYKEVFPFSVEELEALNLPFALLKRQDNGLIRAIILADNEADLLTFISAIKDKQVPVGVPWTLSNGEVITIEED